ncbi:hypothetical protein O6H91_14G035300 [Diphasiastrum complanatum]|uniref:Uncharacterized protein n=1 Tax=Diphasiastrum complanatum TaxID=34168 RepID=A0ACC2BP59_DIPCM|nr:hypothetical protein O6H91_14G035300 [Diphasiastrum complanatum]
MSVYGGDSWVPEAQQRRRRVDELLSDSVRLDDEGEIKRLANGRIACLVCPNHPLLDTMPMLMVHRKGSGHQAAVAKRSKKEFHQREQLQKRIALSLHDGTSANSPAATPLSATIATGFVRNSAPLLVETRKCAAHLLFSKRDHRPGSFGNLSDAASNLSTLPGSHPVQSFSCDNTTRSALHLNGALITSEVASKKDMKWLSRAAHAIPKAQFADHALTPIPQNNEKQEQEIQIQQERELRLREAGWRRDALGGWFKEENVEFDSDEETPKFSL